MRTKQASLDIVEEAATVTKFSLAAMDEGGTPGSQDREEDHGVIASTMILLVQKSQTCLRASALATWRHTALPSEAKYSTRLSHSGGRCNLLTSRRKVAKKSIRYSADPLLTPCMQPEVLSQLACKTHYKTRRVR